MICLDIQSFMIINSAHSPLLDMIFLAITQLGNAAVAAPVLAAIIVIQGKRISSGKGHYVRHAIIFTVIAVSMSGITGGVIKTAVKRHRPLKYFSAQTAPCPVDYTVHVIGPRYKYRSFPSGHTNTAFSAACSLIFLFGGWYWLALIPAALVGYSRVYLGVHFPLDVVAGAVLAWGVTAGTAFLYAPLKKATYAMQNST